ncbi:hypothetical protein BG006_009920 [Podila minutissima]|uniref:Kelch repeat-containing protein n=1 Tax=Podila minutissima TaxID=64525 RepID=A0A9P5VQ73_9FUNG|nr:hypothetical protein BG006_009920 [Podila minutissima]
MTMSRSTLAQVITDPTDPKGGPGTVANANYVFNDQKLYLSDGYYNGADKFQMTPRQLFYSLDLTAPWPTSKPAWTKLVRQDRLHAGRMGLSKDGSVIYFFTPDSVQPYNVQKAEWGVVTNFTTAEFGTSLVATDTDSGKIIGVRRYVPTYPEGPRIIKDNQIIFSEFDPKDNSIVKTALNITEFTEEVAYSSARKSLFFAATGPDSNLYEYNLATKNFSAVIGKGQVPQYRKGACFASANGGKTLILAGGQKVYQPSTDNVIGSRGATPMLTDVSVFDVETSTWTKVTETPNAYYQAACAVSGDSLILYGGFDKLYPIPQPNIHNDNVPVIFNLKDKVWVANYTPSAVPPPPPRNSGSGNSGSGSGSGGGSGGGSGSGAVALSPLLLGTMLTLVGSSVTAFL